MYFVIIAFLIKFNYLLSFFKKRGHSPQKKYQTQKIYKSETHLTDAVVAIHSCSPRLSVVALSNTHSPLLRE